MLTKQLHALYADASHSPETIHVDTTGMSAYAIAMSVRRYRHILEPLLTLVSFVIVASSDGETDFEECSVVGNVSTGACPELAMLSKLCRV